MKQLETNTPRQMHHTTQFFPTFTNKKKAKKNQASVPRLWSVLVTESKKEKTIQTLKLSIQQKFFLMIFTNNQ